jgi:hypothetical protein
MANITNIRLYDPPFLVFWYGDQAALLYTQYTRADSIAAIVYGLLYQPGDRVAAIISGLGFPHHRHRYILLPDLMGCHPAENGLGQSDRYDTKLALR